MQSVANVRIDLEATAKAGKTIVIEAGDDFFAQLEQEEIAGGNVCMEIKVKHYGEACFEAEIRVTGSVIVSCDRCLEDLQLEVETSDVIKIKDGELSEDDDPMMVSLPKDEREYDFSWNIYEIIETSLPLKKVHEDGSCSEDMVRRICRDETICDE